MTHHIYRLVKMGSDVRKFDQKPKPKKEVRDGTLVHVFEGVVVVHRARGVLLWPSKRARQAVPRACFDSGPQSARWLCRIVGVRMWEVGPWEVDMHGSKNQLHAAVAPCGRQREPQG